MNDLDETYKTIEESIKSINEEINYLEKDENVKRLYSLKKLMQQLLEEKKEIVKQLQVEQYDKCNHIWIKKENEFKDYNIYEMKDKTYYGCVKCGLDETILDMAKYGYIDMLDSKQRLMLSFMNNNNYEKGIIIDEKCDFNLATAIYNKIKKHHPDIDDETAYHYLCVAIKDIKNIKVNKKRKKDRAKRLKLKPNFNKW